MGHDPFSNIKFRVLADSIMAGTEAWSDERDERGRKTREQYEAESRRGYLIQRSLFT